MATSPEIQAAAFKLPTAQELGFDPLQLRHKYAEERERRMRSEGNAQYLEVAGEHEHFNDDPYIDQVLVREPLSETVDVLIVGGGFGGQRQSDLGGHRGLAQRGDRTGTRGRCFKRAGD